MSKVDRYGRRLLLFCSGSVVSIALAAMGAFFYCQMQWGEAEASASLGWLPLLSLIVFFIAYSGGYSNVPFILMGEMFPSRFRSVLGPLTSSFNLMCTFTVVRSFPEMQKNMTKHGVFWFFMCCTMASLVFVYFLLPETKGKTLEDIEKLFSIKYNKDGTLKEPAKAVVADNSSVHPLGMMPSAGETLEMQAHQSKENGITHSTRHYYGHHADGMTANNSTASTLNIIDSEDEEEDDGVPVAAPI